MLVNAGGKGVWSNSVMEEKDLNKSLSCVDGSKDFVLQVPCSTSLNLGIAWMLGFTQVSARAKS